MGWRVLPFLVAAYLYALWQAPLLVGGATAALGVYIAAQRLYAKRQLQRLACGRSGESICSFSHALDVRSVDAWVVRAVYEEVQHHLNGEYPAFPLRPADRLEEDLMIDPEDLDVDLAPDIAQRTGRSLRDITKNPYFGRVKTVGDLVEFFSAQPGGAGEQADAADEARG